MVQEAQVKFFNDHFDQALLDAAIANNALQLEQDFYILGFVPVLGTAIDGYQVYYDASTGNYVAVAVGVGLVVIGRQAPSYATVFYDQGWASAHASQRFNKSSNFNKLS